MKSLISKIESSNFECEAGSLKLSNDWQDLKKKLGLWVIVKNSQIIQHTEGEGGRNFTVCTNEGEAQSIADRINRERYGGAKFCSVQKYVFNDEVVSCGECKKEAEYFYCEPCLNERVSQGN